MANDYNKTEAVDERLAELLRSSMVHKATGLQTSLKAMAATFEQVDNTLAEWLPKLDGNRLAARGTAFLLALNTQMSVSLSSLFHFLFLFLSFFSLKRTSFSKKIPAIFKLRVGCFIQNGQIFKFVENGETVDR